MTDWNEFVVRHDGTDTEFLVREARLVGPHEGESSDLIDTLSVMERELARAESDLDRADVVLERRAAEHAAVQTFIDKVKSLLEDNDCLVIEDWDDFDKEFSEFDGFDLDRPRRDWSADVELTVKVSVSGEADTNLDEDDIASIIRDNIGFGEIGVSVSFSYDNCEGGDSDVEDYDVDSVDVTFDD